jgi:bla regulator protein BlaR1
MMRVAAVLLVGVNLYAQSTGAADRFEVVSIRASEAKGGRPSMEFPPGGIRANNVTLKQLIQMAYDIRPEQLSGGAGWTDSEEYTVIAKGTEASMEVTRKRMQELLRERFQLELKSESSAAVGYALTVAKGGHKMTRASESETRQMRQVGRWQLRAERVDIPLLARFLSVHLKGTVVDRAALDGAYDFRLNWTPAEPVPIGSDAPEESLIPAVEEQLGLKLERQNVATDRYTIERAERPTEN